MITLTLLFAALSTSAHADTQGTCGRFIVHFNAETQKMSITRDSPKAIGYTAINQKFEDLDKNELNGDVLLPVNAAEIGKVLMSGPLDIQTDEPLLGGVYLQKVTETSDKFEVVYKNHDPEPTSRATDCSPEANQILTQVLAIAATAQ